MAEKAEQERTEAEKAEALKKAEIEAKEAEAAGKTVVISDPRIDIMEKSLEEIKADQKVFKEVLNKQAESQTETKSKLDLILEMISRKP